MLQRSDHGMIHNSSGCDWLRWPSTHAQQIEVHAGCTCTDSPSDFRKCELLNQPG